MEPNIPGPVIFIIDILKINLFDLKIDMENFSKDSKCYIFHYSPLNILNSKEYLELCKIM